MFKNKYKLYFKIVITNYSINFYTSKNELIRNKTYVKKETCVLTSELKLQTKKSINCCLFKKKRLINSYKEE